MIVIDVEHVITSVHHRLINTYSLVSGLRYICVQFRKKNVVVLVFC